MSSPRWANLKGAWPRRSPTVRSSSFARAAAARFPSARSRGRSRALQPSEATASRTMAQPFLDRIVSLRRRSRRRLRQPDVRTSRTAADSDGDEIDDGLKTRRRRPQSAVPTVPDYRRVSDATAALAWTRNATTATIDGLPSPGTRPPIDVQPPSGPKACSRRRQGYGL